MFKVMSANLNGPVVMKFYCGGIAALLPAAVNLNLLVQGFKFSWISWLLAIYKNKP